jgi:hypothetical protein
MINTKVKNRSMVCEIGRLAGGASKFICSSCFTFSSLRKIKAIISPITTAKTIAPIILAIPISVPRMLQVRMIESMLMAGPE